MSVESEVLKATGYSKQAGQDEQAFLAGTVRALQELSDADFEKLSKPAQAWGNRATDALDKKKPIPGFLASAANGKAKPKVKAKEVKPKPKVKAKPKAKPAASKKKKTAAAAPRETGIKVQIKKLVLKNPKISVEDIMAAMAKKGGTPSRLTVTAIRSEFRHTMRVLAAEGMVKWDG